MTSDPVADAQTLLDAGRPLDAITMIDTAAASGHPSALFQQGLWRLAGRPLPRDLPLARTAFAQAARQGHDEARIIDATLTANGTGAPADWEGALHALRAAAAVGHSYAQHLVHMLDAMPLTADGRPTVLPAIDHLSADGSVRRARTFLSPAERAHIANSGIDMMAPSMVADPATGLAKPHPIRTSDAATISPIREDPVIRAILMRIATMTDTHVDQGEALTILRYRPGQQFRLHSDVLPGAGNQRIRTVLLYLNDGYVGGQTTFPDHGLSIMPKAGDAIIFDNVDARQAPLARSRHAGEPVTHGVKWLASRWIRARPFDVWAGPESV